MANTGNTLPGWRELTRQYNGTGQQRTIPSVHSVTGSSSPDPSVSTRLMERGSGLRRTVGQNNNHLLEQLHGGGKAVPTLGRLDTQLARDFSTPLDAKPCYPVNEPVDPTWSVSASTPWDAPDQRLQRDQEQIKLRTILTGKCK